MNRSKLYEWLLDNDCPWDFELDDSSSYCMCPRETPILFSNKEDKLSEKYDLEEV
jgi:hypothetical protein